MRRSSKSEIRPENFRLSLDTGMGTADVVYPCGPVALSPAIDSSYLSGEGTQDELVNGESAGAGDVCIEKQIATLSSCLS